MRSVDFEAIRAETNPGEPIEVVDGKQKFLVTPQLSWLAIEAWDNRGPTAALREVLVDPDKRTTKTGPTNLERFHAVLFADGVDLRTALRRLVSIWNVEGESSASSRSSSNGGSKSRPTSATRTRSG